MTKKNNRTYKAELWIIEVQCLDCSNKFEVMGENVTFSASSTPCDICGDHGYINADVVCPYCKYTVTIELYSW